MNNITCAKMDKKQFDIDCWQETKVRS